MNVWRQARVKGGRGNRRMVVTVNNVFLGLIDR